MVLGFFFVLNFTHICHYCVFTKKVVKRKVKRDVDIEMGKLAKAPKANEGGEFKCQNWFNMSCLYTVLSGL